LQRRLYEALRAAILDGTYPPGSRLPATRALALDARVARQTVVLVYERLIAEGYAAGRVGAGTYVSASLEAGGEPPADESERHPVRGSVAAPALPRSDWAERALGAPAQLWQGAAGGVRFDFRPGVPDWNAFPHTTWRRLLARRWRRAEATPALAQYGDPAGYRPLREALAAYLARSRGVRCTAEQVVIVSGSQQALDLLVRVCLNPGDGAAVEHPGYPPVRAILAAAGTCPQLIAVDGEGVDVTALPASRQRPVTRMVYVTPSHQYPTGATLSLRRRLELLGWAAGADALIVEDDYDSELRYDGPPLPALQGLDRRGCVAYVGSCSSVLFPPLRVGWIVAPSTLVGPLVASKWLSDRQTGTLEQQVLADFIDGGHFERHLRRSRRLYGGRRAALVAAMARHLPRACVLSGDSAGLQAMLRLPAGTDERAVVREAARRGVGVAPIGPCYDPELADPEATVRDGAPHAPGLLLGFAAVPASTLEDGVRRLAAGIRAAGR
jgi:GntR family transcriptional regulator/MocR family aminotransferase